VLDRLGRGDDLHALVRGVRFRATTEGGVGHDPRPTPRPGVPEARAVGVRLGYHPVILARVTEDP
jgi:hypothetical protein